MLTLLFRSALASVGLASLAGLSAVEEQLRDVVSKEVAVARSEAGLRLEFSDDGTLEIAFEDGVVLIDGDVVGMFEPGDALEVAWRSLLGRAVSLDDGELAIMLSDWSVPAELAGDLADLAQEVDRALEDALLGFSGCVVVISHDRWFLDRIATHILAFEGDSHVEWFEGNYDEYEKDRRRRLGADADQPHRIKYRRIDA